MPLSWNEIKNRAIKFSKEWENVSSEKAKPNHYRILTRTNSISLQIKVLQVY